jgi:hypothetical protein
MVALYPSAAGVTESLLPSATLEVVFERVRASQRLVADVEAVVVRRSPGGGDLFLVPIDACYELAGRIRQQWRGFGGGSEAQRAIESFFTMLHDRAELAPV